MMKLFKNPFRPGAGQNPPYLAGRTQELETFDKLLDQDPIIKNVILTGLRGVGKTVLLEEYRPLALNKKWFWIGSDLSESASVSEAALGIRILTDLAVIGSSFTIAQNDIKSIGYQSEIKTEDIKLNYHVLKQVYDHTPGLEADKLKHVLELFWNVVKNNVKGVVLAYDEAQILKDKAEDKQYPLSVMLEVVQYLQRKNIPYLLVLTGLPTLYPNLVEARTYAERMFQIITLTRLIDSETREAILKPIQQEDCPVSFTEQGIQEIINYSSGYPYFIQFFCKETFDLVLQQISNGVTQPNVIIADLIQKLDIDFYSGRWSRITDRQRDLLITISRLTNCDEEFTVKEIVDKSKEINTEFKASYVNSLLLKLIEAGLIYKNRRSKYTFAVPMLGDFIRRQELIN